MSLDRTLLFREFDLRRALEGEEHKLRRAIETIDAARLGTDLEGLVVELVQRHSVQPLAILEDKVTTRREETQVDVRHDPTRLILDRSQPAYVRGTRISFFVPFTGDPVLLRCHPSSFTTLYPRATIDGNDLILTYEQVAPDANRLQSDFKEDLRTLAQWIRWVNDDVQQHNASLPAKTRDWLQLRQQRLRADDEAFRSLGYPERKPEPPAPVHRPTAIAAVTSRAPSPAPTFKYDAALSFAGEDRALASDLATRLKAAGLSVFYDEDEQHTLWGEDLAIRLYEIYCRDSRYCVIFGSHAYLDKEWPRHELRSALDRLIREKGAAYILPIHLAKGIHLPGLPATTGHIDIDTGLERIAALLVKKLGSA